MSQYRPVKEKNESIRKREKEKEGDQHTITIFYHAKKDRFLYSFVS